MNYDIETLLQNDGFTCPACGKIHRGKLGGCVIGRGAIEKLPEAVRQYNGTKPFILCDSLTYIAAGEKVCRILDETGIPYALHTIERIKPSPDERIVGEAVMHCPPDCDLVIAVGGGVLNDTGKILAANRGIPDFIVGTAPSMDGFASATSSMERDGLKVSLPSKCPDIVFGDPEVLAKAPVHMIRSGVGDMLAKYVSLVEWQIAELLIGEPYCPVVADIVRTALDSCVKSAGAAVEGDEDAVCRVMEGLVISGLAMNYAGISRPASGMEHYISHILDMRALEFGTSADLHGIQCGVATLVTVRAYEKLMQLTPDRDKALTFVRDFDPEAWNEHLRTQLGHGAEAIIAGERKEKKYDPEKHAARLEKILANWERIREIVAGLPKSGELEAFMKAIGHPTTFTELGITESEEREAFLMAKDIRDKYVLGRLLWDLGEME